MKGEEVRAEYYRGFGDREIYRFEDVDGEVLWFEMSGRSIEECRKIKDEWLSEKRANKSLYDKISKQYWAAYDMAKTLTPGEAVMIRTQGICVESYRQEYEYHRDLNREYYLILKHNKEFDWFTHAVYAASPSDCKNKMQEYLDELSENDDIVDSIKGVIEC